MNLIQPPLVSLDIHERQMIAEANARLRPNEPTETVLPKNTRVTLRGVVFGVLLLVVVALVTATLAWIVIR